MLDQLLADIGNTFVSYVDEVHVASHRYTCMCTCGCDVVPVHTSTHFDQIVCSSTVAIILGRRVTVSVRRTVSVVPTHMYMYVYMLQ